MKPRQIPSEATSIEKKEALISSGKVCFESCKDGIFVKN